MMRVGHWKFGRIAGLAAVVVALLTVAPAAAWAGDMADVTVKQARDPVNGVRMIEIEGTMDGGQHSMWVMISDRNYAKLIGCKRTKSGVGAAVQYSDKSGMVNVVVCDS